MAKGIRVNQLAKELGVTSKAILDRCKAEGLGDEVPQHMSLVKLGLAETIKEWFAAGPGGIATAVEEPAPKKSAARKKPAKKKEGEVEAAPPAPEAPTATAAPTAPAEIGHPVAAPTPAELPPAPPPPAPEVAPVPPAVAAEVAAPAPAPARPPSPATARPPAADVNRASVVRPTVSVNQPRVAPPPERKPVVVAPQLTSIAPASIQGPKIVRIMQPDMVAAPRRAPKGADAPSSPGVTTARQQGGRGVKVIDDDSEEGEQKRKAGAKGGRTNSGRRRGSIDGRRGDAVDKIKEFSEQDLADRRRRIAESAKHRRDFDVHLRQVEGRGHHIVAKTTVQKGEPVDIQEPISVRSLASALGIKGNDIVRKLFTQGMRDVNINSSLDNDTAGAMALEYGIELHVRPQETLGDKLESEISTRAVSSTGLVTRPPVVAILGHVDHGKTSLLDKIRHANVAAGEAGGITQHTAAWMVTLGEGQTAKRVTFIDTPGHQAFTSMRARGANMTDVVVLVVSAAEGVQPQTIESINHARAAGVLIVVALNKIDRPDSNPEMVLGQLAAQGLNPVEYGGETEVIRTSATTGQGIPDLIEILDYQSQLLELKADPGAPARGVVIESFVDPGLGPVATVLVQDGTLKVGDAMLTGVGFGRIRSIVDDRRKSLDQAGPSMPVIVSGLDRLPDAGDKFYVLDDVERARSIAEERQSAARQENLAQKNRVTATNIFDEIRAGQVQTINLIIKGDVQGSVETLTKTVTDANTEEVKVKVIHSGVGEITESDVELAMATKAKPTDNKVAIIGFHVVADDTARALAEQNHIDLKLYRVIYEIFDDLKKALSGMLTPEQREKLHGHAEIRQVIKVSKIGNVAGCFVTDGHIQRGSKMRLSRNGVVITQDLNIESLRRIKDDVREVKAGLECGIKLAGYDDIKIGDVLEAYVRETFQRTL